MSVIQNYQKGVSLIITFLIMSIMLAVVISVSLILSDQIKIVSNIGSSISSLYAAESGLEKTLYFDRKQVVGGANRGLCNICNLCSSNDCKNCTYVSLSTDTSNGCDLQSCTNCKVMYTSAFDQRQYQVTASVTSGGSVFSAGSQGFYREA